MERKYLTAWIAAMAIVASAGKAPAQDTCSAPFIMVGNSAAFDTTSATTDAPTQTNCGSNIQITKDVWYRWTAPCGGSVTGSLCGTTFDTKLAVYDSCPVGNNTALACNDDSNVCSVNSLQSNITFNSIAGTNYLFRIGGFNGASGNGTLNVTPPNCGPANDLCDNATIISGYGATAFTNVGASNSGPAPTTCGTGNSIATDVWFTYTSCVAGSHTIDTCTGGNFDTAILIYTGPCNALVQVACNDDACGVGGLSSSATWTATANTLYHIRVGGYLGAVGSGMLTLSGPACPPPAPANDNCNNRIDIAVGATPYSTLGATTDGPAHATCLNAGSNQITNDIWYNFVSTCTGTLTADTCNNNSYDSKIAVYAYDGTCATINDQTLLACNDDACGNGGLASSVAVPVQLGHSYAIRVGGFNGATGTGTLTVGCTPGSLPGDMNCDNVVNLSDLPFFITALVNPGAFAGCDISRGDMNVDGAVNGRDIKLFVTALLGP